ncbi:MAG: hypothetical protein MRY72_07110 [Aquisalinus sp.]|nr:hypothetical protein [Aquisalinus sp.]
MQSVKHYQELKGAENTDMRISFETHNAEAFFNNNPPVVQLLGIKFEIRNISQTGQTMKLPEGISLAPVAEAQTLSFLQSGTCFYECPVVLQPLKTGVAEIEVLYDQRGVDIGVIARKNAAALARRQPGAQHPSITCAVPAEYRVFCTEVLDYLSDRRSFIENNIAPHEDYFTLEEADAVSYGLEEASEADWARLCFAGNELVLPHMHDEALRPAIKSFTEKLLTYELVKGTNWHRSYFKPMGYPGDFRIMNYMYDHQPEGTTTYSRYLHMLGLISGRPIVSRMDYISRYLENLRQGADNIYHVMSIGSGPAREVQRFLENSNATEEGYSFTLVDQEIQALDYGINAAYQSLAPSRSNVIVSGMHTSFTEMLRPMSTFRHLPKQHLIYSAGLLDYLNAGLCRKLTSKLYDHLCPGGTLLVGNVNDSAIGTYWPMEYILDWTLYFRNEQEMYDMATGCEGAEVSVEMDDNGAVYMLKVTKPA